MARKKPNRQKKRRKTPPKKRRLLPLFAVLAAALLISRIPALLPSDDADLSDVYADLSGEAEEEENGYLILDADSDFDLDEAGIDIPEYEDAAIIEVNDGEPYFTVLYSEFFIQLTELDELGRAGSAMMCADEEDLQTGEREDISAIHPSGWIGDSIYDRSHLLMWKLSGCNDERNLITGASMFNTESMLTYEMEILYFLYDNEDMHVMYRVTPLFEGEELVARGVLMEAVSVEDGGAGLMFCVFCYNVEDGYTIDYTDGEYYFNAAEWYPHFSSVRSRYGLRLSAKRSSQCLPPTSIGNSSLQSLQQSAVLQIRLIEGPLLIQKLC